MGKTWILLVLLGTPALAQTTLTVTGEGALVTVNGQEITPSGEPLELAGDDHICVIDLPADAEATLFDATLGERVTLEATSACFLTNDDRSGPGFFVRFLDLFLRDSTRVQARANFTRGSLTQVYIPGSLPIDTVTFWVRFEHPEPYVLAIFSEDEFSEMFEPLTVRPAKGGGQQAKFDVPFASLRLANIILAYTGSGDDVDVNFCTQVLRVTTRPVSDDPLNALADLLLEARAELAPVIYSLAETAANQADTSPELKEQLNLVQIEQELYMTEQYRGSSCAQ